MTPDDSPHAPRREHLISWASRRGQDRSGWYRFVAPAWWPSGPRAQWVLASTVALAVKTRFALFPPAPAVADDDAGPGAVAEMLDQIGGPLPMRLAPEGSPAGIIAPGLAGEVVPEGRALVDLVMRRGLEVDPEHWRSGFALAPVVHPLPWVPAFGAFGTVAGLVGRGWSTYLRILHPLEECDDDGHVVRRTPWRELGGTAPSEPGWRPDRLPDGRIDHEATWAGDARLSEGTIPERERAVLSGHLHRDLVERHDTGPVVQGLWEGFNLNLESATGERIRQPERDIVPFVGAFDGIAVFDDWHTSSLVFPTSGAWCLANDTDLVSTYLGCDDDLAQRVIADGRVEFMIVGPGDDLG